MQPSDRLTTELLDAISLKMQEPTARKFVIIAPQWWLDEHPEFAGRDDIIAAQPINLDDKYPPLQPTDF